MELSKEEYIKLKQKEYYLNKYNISDPYWSHDTKLSDYVKLMGGCGSGDVQLVYLHI